MLKVVYNDIVYQKIPYEKEAMVLGLENKDNTEPIDIEIVDKIQIGKSWYPVTKIANYAFSKQKLNIVKLPSTIRRIGDYAFHGSSVKQIIRAKSYLATDLTVGDHAFWACLQLEKVCFNGPVELFCSSFWGCMNLKEIDSFNFCNLPSAVFLTVGLEMLYVSNLLKIVEDDAFAKSSITDIYFIDEPVIQDLENCKTVFEGKKLHCEPTNSIVNWASEGFEVIIEDEINDPRINKDWFDDDI